MNDGGALYFGAVAHRRLRPVGHRLEYRVFSMLVDLDRLDALDRGLRYFSRNRFNLFSFHDRDYGHGRPADLAGHIRATLAKAGVAADGRIRLLCYPRILGYAFNPLAVYYCANAAGDLAAIIYEVRNTFGGRHSYLIPIAEGGGAVIRQSADKAFHVSPFMAMDMRYDFRLSPLGERLAVAIRQSDAAGPILHASFAGVRRPLDDRTLLRAFFQYPLMTVKVIAAIHFEAVRLLLKGLRLQAGAPEPADPVSVVGTSSGGARRRLRRAA
jgi:hypothetical protein